MKKRVMSCLLAICMTFSLVPSTVASVFADNEPAPDVLALLLEVTADETIPTTGGPIVSRVGESAGGSLCVQRGSGVTFRSPDPENSAAGAADDVDKAVVVGKTEAAEEGDNIAGKALGRKTGAAAFKQDTSVNQGEDFVFTLKATTGETVKVVLPGRVLL